jgi:hypothetical protein
MLCSGYRVIFTHVCFPITDVFPSSRPRSTSGTPSDKRKLLSYKLNAAAHTDSAESRGANGFGNVYVVRFPLRTTKGAATIISGWIIRHGEDFPRLTTCYIV